MSDWDRFWSKVNIPADGRGCWLWTGYVDVAGYGKFRFKGEARFAHRVAYELAIGPIPSGLTIDHVRALGCTSHACVNPLHLEPVTNAENIRRGERWQLRKTHCPQGHPYSGDNLRRYIGAGGRQCVTCSRARAAAQYLAKKAAAAHVQA